MSKTEFTPARRLALLVFERRAPGPTIPRDHGIRNDVARFLFDAGYVETCRAGDLFRGGYAPLKLTASGRAALSASSGGGKPLT